MHSTSTAASVDAIIGLHLINREKVEQRKRLRCGTRAGKLGEAARRRQRVTAATATKTAESISRILAIARETE